MADASYLCNQLLIAMPGMVGDVFDRTVTYLCDHSADGAMGLVINRPTDLSVEAMLEHMDIDVPDAALGGRVFWGGPVQSERGFVLHRQPGVWDATLSVHADYHVTTSRDILEAIARGEGPADFLITLGYAGWGSGQLEAEIRANSWLNCAADTGILYNKPADQRWQASLDALGLDPGFLSASAGHA